MKKTFGACLFFVLTLCFMAQSGANQDKIFAKKACKPFNYGYKSYFNYNSGVFAFNYTQKYAYHLDAYDLPDVQFIVDYQNINNTKSIDFKLTKYKISDMVFFYNASGGGFGILFNKNKNCQEICKGDDIIMLVDFLSYGNKSCKTDIFISDGDSRVNLCDIKDKNGIKVDNLIQDFKTRNTNKYELASI